MVQDLRKNGNLKDLILASNTRLELYGIVFIVIAGSLLHFAYEALGEMWWIAIFAAMDESVWEHLKLAFWPAALWMVLTGPRAASNAANFWLAKAVSITLMPLIIAFGFYAYTAALGHHALVWDMLLFIGAITIGQISALIVYQLPETGAGIARLAKSILLVEAVAFGTLTFLHIDLPIFVDAG